MNRGNLASLLHLAAWFVVISIAILARTDFPLPQAAAKLTGELVFLCGMFVFAWAVAFLKGGFLGNVEPVSDAVVTQGPYKFVRHPVYLGMVVATVGLVIALSSLWGLLATLLFFTPTAIYRARLEEDAMARKFGREWDDYVSRTSFMLPRIY